MASQTISAEFDPRRVVLGPNDGRPRIIHTMVRVQDLDASLRFYEGGLGMQVLDRFTLEAKRATAIFVGFDDHDAGAPLELTRYWDDEGPYTHGSGYGHAAVGVSDAPEVFARLEAMGAQVIMRPGVLVPGGPCCAFVKDPDGYAIEIVETSDRRELSEDFDPRRVILGPRDGKRRLLHTMLRVRDLGATLRFYEGAVGMQVLERVDVAVKRATGVFIAFNAEDAGRALELTHYWDAETPYSHGSGYGHVAIGVLGLEAVVARLEAAEVEITERPSALAPGAPSRAFVKDPDGYDVEFIETRRD